MAEPLGGTPLEVKRETRLKGRWNTVRFSLLLLPSVALVALSALAACTPEIGDKCILSTDCSVRSDRVCDTSQPNGYCTQNCRGNSCPDKAACVLYNTSLQGCGFDDRSGPFGSRVARSFCSARCFSNADCRTEEGYVCADPKLPPWNAFILDDVQDQLVCLVIPSEGLEAGVDTSTRDAAVCKPTVEQPAPIDAGKAKMTDAGAAADVVTVDAGADTGIVDSAVTDAADGGG
jgi:hypothetical protein